MDCTNDSELNNADRRELVVILMAGSPVYNCYTRRDLRKILTAEYEKGICEYDARFLNDRRRDPNLGKKLSAPVFKEPYFGVFMDKSVIAFQDHDCLLLYNPRSIPVYSAYAVSAIHGAEVTVCSVYPLSLAYFLERTGIERGERRQNASVRELTSEVVRTITPEVQERLNRDVDFILRGGDANFIGQEYRERVSRDIKAGLALDFPLQEQLLEKIEREQEEERMRRTISARRNLGPLVPE